MSEPLFVCQDFTPPGGFTEGIEGPACDALGNLYAVNYARQGTIGKVTARGECSVFVELPPGSIGNGIRFNSTGEMLIADYTRHNIWKVDMSSRHLDLYAHHAALHQPNDLAIGANDILYASDPDWQHGCGRIWRVDLEGNFSLLEDGMGTTNGIEVSPDEASLYVNESLQRRIWAYDLRPSGSVSNKRLLIEFPDYGLDGMRCDAAGDLFVTRYGKGCVARISAQGEIQQEIPLPGKNCTNLAFGGPDGCTVYVTLADRGNVARFQTDIPGRCWKLAASKKHEQRQT